MPAAIRLLLVALLASGSLSVAGLGTVPAASLGFGLALAAAWFRGAPSVIQNEVRAVRQDPDFGRLGLFGDRVWRGSVEMPGLPRPLDLEIETEGPGPTLAHRLALRDARLRWSALEREIDGRLRVDPDDASPTYLTLRLPSEGGFADQDWCVEGLLPATRGERGFQVRVRGGGVVGVDLAA